MTPDAAAFNHISVLSHELIEGLMLHDQGLYLDATVGGGGHSALILEQSPQAQVIALDQDIQALDAARAKLHDNCDRIRFWQGNFSTYDPEDLRFDGIIADLGVSSAQLDRPERGFSFRHDAELDMRMDQSQDLTAADVINTYSERDLADIFFHYGEERFSRRIARKIVSKRPLHTTSDLARVVASSLPPPKGRRRRIHPATRVFQALRIAVNQELQVLEKFIELAPTWLKPGGRIVIISFHSLEDRIVKIHFRQNPLLQVITKKPMIASEQEKRENSRSRSAKLRIAERVPLTDEAESSLKP
ncbi:16S rRNA (cytosine(1402)-N(4))-methyltransferase RsmH [Acaryochloris sp. 'Moss Beach']|uniref:16S rRNA (cytosine(1402)-N(4))-methyltransferase RsmH n=1 Tax=Acaryochloris sp. 'Moss Beach' TaxID=2740837 RepID=UPI001F1D5759|nr:16S rRNA (cytosine(1402)-N(4))-methyltransferase RsmH [Acaryochloris sp. 'Moss Beach']UJB70063.1 16S rRNA (cytosine(1402)-N(4))-methyltransferase RsmH [Acaryochloris sp. 'Moss Beach']